VEERHKQPGQAVSLAGQPSPSPPLAMYLGYLCPVEEFHVYGYATSTHVKVAYSAKHKRNRENAKSVFFLKKKIKKNALFYHHHHKHQHHQHHVHHHHSPRP
jgi:hypothetical protein